ncbi:DUF2254 domain-containing protein [Rufibacter tibetensis]|uniref:DUF2254 domain-containing protein n=1 Tax=Rufibacter tibetensis TaxID=512763 RepID=A0A0P0CRZ4_9BACT|nr:DUF2254 domain-containing protein [Rufibacter tibetensis]ALJ00211.1 hypothetical protein DC20_16100 [Rufibacter tibetensis]
MNTARQIYLVKKAYKAVVSSISFYPFIIALFLLALSWGTIYLDRISVGKSIISKVSFLQIDNADTARSLLSSLLTGLISLVTFTFSMVMIVLTQVMSSFSPRLLSNLVSSKGNQVVLGTIMGTICYTTVVLSNIESLTIVHKVPAFSVVLAMFLAIVCLFCFIYFIHKISTDIQIGNILNGIYSTTRDGLERELTSGSYVTEVKENGTTVLVRAWDSGHFDTVTVNDFKKRARKLGLEVRLLKNQGMYLLKGDPFLEINQPFTKETKNLLEENILLRHQEIVKENLFYGFKHLTEIAVKALSPAVNDPGTAIQSIDYLTDLLCRFQRLEGRKVVKYQNGEPCVIYAPIPFEETFYLCVASIRPYSSQDVTVQARLINLVTKLHQHDEQKKHTTLFDMQLTAIEEATQQDMQSKVDKQYVQTLLEKARKELKR